MIPYPMFMFKIIWPEDTLDVRALEPMMNGFRFRVSECRKSDMKKLAKYVVSFLNVKNKTYTEYEVLGEITEDGEEYIFHTNDSRFNDDLNDLINSYMNIIDVKLNNDEIEAMEEMSGYVLSSEYGKGIKDYKNRLCKQSLQENHGNNGDLKDEKITNSILCQLKPVEIAISLDSDEMYDAFLNKDKEEFIEFYFEDNCIKDLEISKYKITHLYIGNQFCPYLLPEIGIIESIIKKAKTYDLIPVLVLAPIPEDLIDEVRNIIKSVSKWVAPLEIIVNDYGISLLINEISKEEQIDRKNYILTAGVLLNKRKKDTRINALPLAENIKRNNKCNAFGDEDFNTYLNTKLGIENISYEACGYEIDLGRLPGILHLPRYQTNTSNCVLNSLMTSGCRGKREDLKKCPHFCNDYYIYYPENTGLIGIGNSIFAVSQREIEDFDYLNEMIQKGIKRLVIRL